MYSVCFDLMHLSLSLFPSSPQIPVHYISLNYMLFYYFFITHLVQFVLPTYIGVCGIC